MTYHRKNQNAYEANQRISERHGTQFTIGLHQLHMDSDVRCVDVSLSGARLETQSVLTPGDRVTMIAGDGVGTIELPSEVVWVDPGRLAGVRFLKLSSKSLRWLHLVARNHHLDAVLPTGSANG